MKNKVSVIITTYNDAVYLNRSIGSVINQTYKDIELLLIDDGSLDDKAEKIAHKIQKNTDVPIIYYKKKNGGPSSARNFGIKKATGEYIIFLDADDELLLDSIEWRVKTIKDLDDSYGLIYGTAIKINSKKEKIEVYQEYDGCLKLNSKLIGRNNGIPGGVPYYLFKTTVLRQYTFNEELLFNEDFEILLNILNKYKVKGKNHTTFKRYIRMNSWSKQQVFQSYKGVEHFLQIAEMKKLLDNQEIKQRRKENNLSLIKKIIIKKRDWEEISFYVDEAFKEVSPKGFKENLLYFYIKLIKIKF